jgi:aminoglycoside N3'-acetyltransferase
MCSSGESREFILKLETFKLLEGQAFGVHQSVALTALMTNKTHSAVIYLISKRTALVLPPKVTIATPLVPRATL